MNRHYARRQFLRAVGGLAAHGMAIPRTSLPLATQLAGLAALAHQSSAAADLSSGYKALVCLYLHGGSDSHNWVVPVDNSGYADYSSARADLAWPLARLQGITVSGQASGRAFAMPQEMAVLRKWYEAGKAAIVANVGPLVRPISRAEALSGIALPSKLYSHNDQSATWQALSPEGARSGWGGRMGDILMSANGSPVFTAVSATGNAVFLAGGNVQQYQVSVQGPVTASALSATSVFGSTHAATALSRAYGQASGNRILDEYSRVTQRGIQSNQVLETALASTSVPAIPNTTVAHVSGNTTTLNQLPLLQQLHVVLRTIAAQQRLGMRRQVFMVSMPGFDTHANQMRDQPAHMAQVAAGIDYFLNALSSLGMLNQVTLFTASEFGRTLLSNGDGSDHGWGGHHFVAGGTVRGGQMYGQFPLTALGSADDVGSGRLLPTTSVTALAAALGGWMGLNSSELLQVLPNLNNFGNSLRLF